MDELTAFLNARLGEVEATAKEAASRAPGPWVGAFKQVTAEPPGRITVVADTESAAVSHHIERQEPARVLRDVAAKQAILAVHPQIRRGGRTARKNDVGCEKCDSDDGIQWCPGYCKTVRALAAVWSDHPDYRQEWAVSGDSGASAAHESGKALPP